MCNHKGLLVHLNSCSHIQREWHPPRHHTPASSSWLQLLSPSALLEGHCRRLVSVPTQLRLSIQILPVACPNLGPPEYTASTPAKPSWRHTTAASSASQLSSQTVPHSPRMNTSTRPSELSRPPTRRTPAVTGESEQRKRGIPHKLQFGTVYTHVCT